MKNTLFSKISSFIFKNEGFHQTIAKNSFRLLFSEFLSKIFTFLLGLWISNSLGTLQFWMYNFIISSTTFFVLIVDFGLGALTFRELSKHSEQSEKYFVNGLLIKIALTLVVLIAFWIYVSVDQTLTVYVELLFLFLFHSLLTNFSEFLRVFFRPGEKMEKEAFLKISNGIILLIFTLIFLCFSQTLKSVFCAFLVSSIFNVWFSFFYLRKNFQFKLSCYDFDFCKRILKMSIPFVLWGLVVYFYSDVNIVLLRYFKDESLVALFSAPYKLLTYVYLLFNIVSLSFFKKMVDATQEKERFKNLIKKSVRYHGIISLIFLVFFLVFGKFILKFYGEDFIDCYQFLVILVMVIPFKALSYVYGNALTAMSKEYPRLFIQIFIALLSVLLNLIFIPKYEIFAVCYILLFVEGLLCLSYFCFAHYYRKKLPVG